MQDRNQIDVQTVCAVSTRMIPLDVLSELGRATTVYHQAGPDCIEDARMHYEEALRKFNAILELVSSE